MNQNNKLCKKCNETKDLSCFSVVKARKNAPASYCKPCCAELTKQRKLANPEATKQKDRESYLRHQEARKAKVREYRKTIPKEVMNTKSAQWRKDNPDKVKEIMRKAHAKRKHLVNAQNRARWSSDLDYKLRKVLGHRVRESLKAQGTAKSQSITQLIGCTPQELKRHIEAQFKEGMSWDNHGAWHIDHIRPLASFDLTDTAQQLQAFHWSNVQPLWAHENLAKSDFYPAE